MDTILISSNSKEDTDLLLKLLNKLGMKSRIISEEEKEDYGLIAAMMEADRNEVAEEQEIFNKLQKKCK